MGVVMGVKLIERAQRALKLDMFKTNLRVLPPHWYGRLRSAQAEHILV